MSAEQRQQAEMAQLREQMAHQMRIEKERQNMGLLTLASEVLRHGNTDEITAEKVVEMASKLREFVKG